MRELRPLAERLWEKVDKASSPDGCWLWTAATTRGYGIISNKPNRPKAMYAHRAAWELANGPVPNGMSVLHRCDNPPCVRPEHLFVGTQKDNVRDMIEKGRRATLESTTHFGSDVGTSKLTVDEVVEIRRLYASGMRQIPLGKMFGVHQNSISRIVNRKSWQTAPG